MYDPPLICLDIIQHHSAPSKDFIALSLLLFNFGSIPSHYFILLQQVFNTDMCVSLLNIIRLDYHNSAQSRDIFSHLYKLLRFQMFYIFQFSNMIWKINIDLLTCQRVLHPRHLQTVNSDTMKHKINILTTKLPNDVEAKHSFVPYWELTSLTATYIIGDLCASKI